MTHSSMSSISSIRSSSSSSIVPKHPLTQRPTAIRERTRRTMAVPLQALHSHMGTDMPRISLSMRQSLYSRDRNHRPFLVRIHTSSLSETCRTEPMDIATRRNLLLHPSRKVSACWTMKRTPPTV